MPIGKSESAAIVMPRGGKANPSPQARAEKPPMIWGVNAKRALLNALFIFVDENDRFGGRRIVYLRQLVPAPAIIGIRWVGPHVHIHIHGDAAGPGNQSFITNGGFVTGTFIDANRFVVIEQNAMLDICEIRVRPRISLQPGIGSDT